MTKLMVTYIPFGNIFKIEGVYHYAHGCNCAGAMGKGIAVQFKERFPEMYLNYKRLCKERRFTLGDVFAYSYGKGYVFNLGTQATWKTKADLNAIESSLNRMLLFATENNVDKIALPKIGAGLGGANWYDVKNVIDKVAKDYPYINLMVVENYKED
jgi:O-acetyl-ADP-ribose deacetylase (regulator of RNase III)